MKLNPSIEMIIPGITATSRNANKRRWEIDMLVINLSIVLRLLLRRLSKTPRLRNPREGTIATQEVYEDIPILVSVLVFA